MASPSTRKCTALRTVSLSCLQAGSARASLPSSPIPSPTVTALPAISPLRGHVVSSPKSSQSSAVGWDQRHPGRLPSPGGERGQGKGQLFVAVMAWLFPVPRRAPLTGELLYQKGTFPAHLLGLGLPVLLWGAARRLLSGCSHGEQGGMQELQLLRALLAGQDRVLCPRRALHLPSSQEGVLRTPGVLCSMSWEEAADG